MSDVGYMWLVKLLPKKKRPCYPLIYYPDRNYEKKKKRKEKKKDKKKKKT